MSIIDARKILGDGKIIGVSANNPITAKRAEKNSADYIGVGAIFRSITKPSASVIGIKQLTKIIKTTNLPMVAIGGINSSNAKQLFKLGVAGVAVISSIFGGYKISDKNFSRKIINNLKKFNRQNLTIP